MDFPALPLTDRQTVRRLAAVVDRYGGTSTEDPLSIIDDAVADAFSLSGIERALLSDILEVRHDRLLGELPVRATSAALEAYVDALKSVLQPLLRHSGQRLDCDVHVNDASPMALVELNLVGGGGRGRARVRTSSQALADALALLEASLVRSRGTSIYLRRRYMTFSGSTMRIAKAMDAELWTTTSALDDADHLMAALIRTADAHD